MGKMLDRRDKRRAVPRVTPVSRKWEEAPGFLFRGALEDLLPLPVMRTPFELHVFVRGALLGLILALAGAQLVRPVGAVTTVFLLDGSDSVSLSQRARALCRER